MVYMYSTCTVHVHVYDQELMMYSYFFVKDIFTNHQYHTLIDPGKLEYNQSSENSIFFEVSFLYMVEL